MIPTKPALTASSFHIQHVALCSINVFFCRLEEVGLVPELYLAIKENDVEEVTGLKVIQNNLHGVLDLLNLPARHRAAYVKNEYDVFLDRLQTSWGEEMNEVAVNDLENE